MQLVHCWGWAANHGALCGLLLVQLHRLHQLLHASIRRSVYCIQVCGSCKISFKHGRVNAGHTDGSVDSVSRARLWFILACVIKVRQSWSSWALPLSACSWEQWHARLVRAYKPSGFKPCPAALALVGLGGGCMQGTGLSA
jgi:hypothetical protein